MSEASFGKAILDGSCDDILEAERATGRDALFARHERLLMQLVDDARAGKRIVSIDSVGGAVTIDSLNPANRKFVAEGFVLENQEARGAWFLPEEASLKPGFANVGYYVSDVPRFTMNAVRDESARIDLRVNADALACWALITPFFDALFAPLDLSAPSGKLPTVEQRAKAWSELDECYAQLRLNVNTALAALRPGGGWSKVRLADKIVARNELVHHLLAQTSDEAIRRWRAVVVRQLASGYYKKAKSGKGALARSVLTKPLQRHLAAYFNGDWLAFLTYIEEQPAEGEAITIALPEPRLFIGATPARVAEVAAEEGLATDDVERMLAAMLGKQAGTSPIGERVAVMRRWWEAYDRLHAARRAGMRSLWGLVDDGLVNLGGSFDYGTSLYRQLLPADLVTDVNRLWDGTTLRRYPERIVSEFFPHHRMAETFGPALEFWDGVALTCWFVCEGPSARTTVRALAQYHAAQLQHLDDVGFPIDRSLFAELRAAERRLGPVQELHDARETISEGAFTVTISMNRGTRRDGFEILRDVVTSHRRAWATRHLDAYLADRWGSELRGVGHEFNRRLAARGKPPTFKQFAPLAIDVANHWFNGDVAAVFIALGERAPIAPTRIDLLLGDPLEYVRSVYAALGGTAVTRDDWRDEEKSGRNWDAGRLASEATRYLQMYEALGRPPEPAEFGADRLKWERFGGFDAAWSQYAQVIEAARTAISPTLPTPPPADTERRLAPPTVPPQPPPPTTSAPQQPPSTAATPAQRERHGLLRRLHRRSTE